MKKVTIFNSTFKFTDHGTLSSITTTFDHRKYTYTLRKTPEIIRAVRETLAAFAAQDAVDLLQHGCRDISEDLMSRLVSATKGDLAAMSAASLLLDGLLYHREIVSTFDKLLAEEREAEEQRLREAREREYEDAARELAALYLDACTLDACRKWRGELIDTLLRTRRLHMTFQEDLAAELDLDLDGHDPHRTTTPAIRHHVAQAQDEKDLARLKSRYVAQANAPDMQRVQLLLESGLDVQAVAEGLAASYSVDTLPAAWRDLLVYVDCYDVFLTRSVDPHETTSRDAAYAADEAAKAEALLRMEKVGACSQTAEIDFSAELPAGTPAEVPAELPAEVSAAVPTPPALPVELPAGAVRVQIGRRTWTFSSFDAAAAAFAAEAARRAEAAAAAAPAAVPEEVPAEIPAEVSAEVPAEEKAIGGLFCRAEAAAAAAEKAARLAVAAARRAAVMEQQLQRQLRQGSVEQLAHRAARRIRSIGRQILTKSTAAVAAAVAAFH